MVERGKGPTGSPRNEVIRTLGAAIKMVRELLESGGETGAEV